MAELYGMLSVGYAYPRQVIDYGISDIPLPVISLPLQPKEKNDSIPLAKMMYLYTFINNTTLKLNIVNWLYISKASKFTFKISKANQPADTFPLNVKLKLYAYMRQHPIPKLEKEIELTDKEQSVDFNLVRVIDYKLILELVKSEDYFQLPPGKEEQKYFYAQYDITEWNLR